MTIRDTAGVVHLVTNTVPSHGLEGLDWLTMRCSRRHFFWPVQPGLRPVTCLFCISKVYRDAS